jgi:3-oxoacyl-[acyl-carrier-protein] synthase III
LSTYDISIESIITSTPSEVDSNHNLPFPSEALQKIISNSGIESRRISNKNTTAASLCLNAASHLFLKKDISKEDIGVLVFVTQFPDYILPSSAHILQHQLNLNQDCICIQINEGCAGYVYGLQVASSMLAGTSKKYALLLVGDTTSKVIDANDQATRPLFGDAGSATLLSKSSSQILIKVGSDGSGEEDIKVHGGAFLNGFADPPRLKMDGMNVFMFGISRVPKYINDFCSENKIDKAEIDYLVLHQANKMMNDRIVRKLEIDENKALTSLQNYGNTSSASIPLTITTNLKHKINKPTKFLVCGFGVGLAWGVGSFMLDQNVILDNVEM